MGDEKIQIVATARDQASAVLRKLQGNVTALGNKGRGPLGGLLSGMGAISPVTWAAAAGVGALTGALADGIAGALAEDKQMARLSATLKANVKDWDGSTAAVDRATDAAMDLAFSDDEARESMIKLITATGDVRESTRDMALAMDIARGRGIDLAAATDIVVKANMGNVGALRRMGIELDKGSTKTEILMELQKRYAGQGAAYVETIGGKFEAAQKKVDNFLESLGHVAIQLAGSGIDLFHGPSDNVRRNSPLYPEYYQPGGAGHAASLASQDTFDNMINQMREHMVMGGRSLADVEAQWGTKLHLLEQAVRPTAKKVGEDIGDAVAEGVGQADLVGTLRGNKGFLQGLKQDLNWALRHPHAQERQAQRFSDFLNSPKFQRLSTGNDMQRLIASQLTAKVNTQVAVTVPVNVYLDGRLLFNSIDRRLGNSIATSPRGILEVN